MPRIEDQLLDSVIYLYPSKQAAEDGERAGGTGFLVGMPTSQSQGSVYLYAVTAGHVVREALGNSPVVRFNTRDEKVEISVFTTDQWVHHPNADDVAICPVVLAPDRFKYSFVPYSSLITDRQFCEDPKYGPGDDIFFLGRFVSHEGKTQNRPTVRFGNLAMRGTQVIKSDVGILQESFLVESRSLSGYSGSPVFVYRPQGTYAGSLAPIAGPHLLGVDCGHLSEYAPVLEEDRQRSTENLYVKQNSGMAIVVPGWKLAELLDSEEVERQGRATNTTAPGC